MSKKTVEEVIDRDPAIVAKNAGFSDKVIKQVMETKGDKPATNSEMIIDLFKEEKMQKVLDRQLLITTEARSVGSELTIVKLVFATGLGALAYTKVYNEVETKGDTHEGHA